MNRKMNQLKEEIAQKLFSGQQSSEQAQNLLSLNAVEDEEVKNLISVEKLLELRSAQMGASLNDKDDSAPEAGAKIETPQSQSSSEQQNFGGDAAKPAENSENGSDLNKTDEGQQNQTPFGNENVDPSKAADAGQNNDQTKDEKSPADANASKQKDGSPIPADPSKPVDLSQPSDQVKADQTSPSADPKDPSQPPSTTVDPNEQKPEIQSPLEEKSSELKDRSQEKQAGESTLPSLEPKKDLSND